MDLQPLVHTFRPRLLRRGILHFCGVSKRNIRCDMGIYRTLRVRMRNAVGHFSRRGIPVSRDSFLQDTRGKFGRRVFGCCIRSPAVGHRTISDGKNGLRRSLHPLLYLRNAVYDLFRDERKRTVPKYGIRFDGAMATASAARLLSAVGTVWIHLVRIAKRPRFRAAFLLSITVARTPCSAFLLFNLYCA